MASLSLDEAARLYSTLHHFFEVAVHTVLYYRRLYPERAFAAATAFGVPVHQSRHPAVCAWVRAAVDQVMEQIAGVTAAGAAAVEGGGGPGKKKAGTTSRPVDTSRPPDASRVNAVAVVVHAPYETAFDSPQSPTLPPGAVLERWVFDVRHLPRGWPGGAEALRRAQRDRAKREKRGDAGRERRREQRRRRRQRREGDAGPGDDRYSYYDEQEELANAESEAELDKPVAESEDDGDDDEGANGGSESGLNWTDLHHQLRGVVQRLAQAGQQVAALPAEGGCTFTMAIELGSEEEDNEGGQQGAREMDAHWIPETGVMRARKFGGGDGASSARPGPGTATTTVRSVDAAPLFLECWVEESAVKRAATAGAHTALAAGDGDILPPPPPPASSSTSSYGLDTSLSFDKTLEQSSFDTPGPKNKGKGVAFD